MPLTRGDRLAKYEIIASLGSGGMGDVYRAHDPRLEREVAIKVIRAAATNTDSHARLWREARVAASVSHPGVCQIYDVGESDDQLFIVMELLTGEPLASRMRDGVVPLDQAVTIALGVLGALGALHSRQIVHRDLKPSNVFLTDGGVKLLDFGLARSRYSVTGADLTLTQAGTVVGTPRYMAPEQWTGTALDPRSDLFAVGAILFEMLAGKPAFPGHDLMQVYHAVMSGYPPPLSGSPTIAAVDGVIHRSLEKRPEERYQTAEAMAQALRSAISLSTDTSTVTVRPTTRLIAVPFRMLRPDADVDFLSFSLPDAIVSSLAGLPSLVVRSTLASANYTSGGTVDLKALAADAGVDAVLCGTLLKAGDQIRVTAQLVEAASSTILCTKTVQLALHDIFEAQDQLARAIVEALSIPLKGEAQPRRDLPASARAYEFYLRANQLAYDFSMLSVAGEMYRSALDEDPQYAPAWAKLGRVYRLLAKYGSDEGEVHLRKAEQAFQRALQINPDSTIAHNLYTNFEIELQGRAKEAMVRLLERARSQAADPELFAGLVIACRFCGLLDASLAADRQARRLDPAIRTSVAYTHFMRGDWDKAIATDADDLRWVTNWALPMVGRSAEAVAFYRANEERPLPVLVRLLMKLSRLTLEGSGEAALEAIHAIKRARAFDPEGIYFIGRSLVQLGRTDAALDTLARVVDDGFFCVPTLLHDPWLDPIRREPRFTEIVSRANARSLDAETALKGLGGDRLLTSS